jgi:hypothetical protein
LEFELWRSHNADTNESVVSICQWSLNINCVIIRSVNVIPTSNVACLFRHWRNDMTACVCVCLCLCDSWFQHNIFTVKVCVSFKIFSHSTMARVLELWCYE